MIVEGCDILLDVNQVFVRQGTHRSACLRICLLFVKQDTNHSACLHICLLCVRQDMHHFLSAYMFLVCQTRYGTDRSACPHVFSCLRLLNYRTLFSLWILKIYLVSLCIGAVVSSPSMSA